MKKKQLAAMTPAQRTQTLDWVGAYQKAREDNAPELPPAPSFVLHPAELTAAGDVLEEAAQAKPEKAKAARAPRRSTAKFKNSPRIAKGKKKGK